MILAIGNFSSKFLSFLLVPLYTFYLSPADYGKIDIYMTSLLMLYIVVSMQSVETAFRFIQDCESDHERTEVFSNVLITALAGIVFFSVLMIIVGLSIKFEYSGIFILHVASSILVNIFLQTLRGMKKMATYSVMGVISTIVQVICNITFIAGLGLGSISLLWTAIISNVIIMLIIIFNTKILRYYKMNSINIKIIKTQLKFSLPLIPNAICIWLMLSLGRYILLFFYGTEEVGILAFTLKFPMLLVTINSIFMMAWQVSAIEQYKTIEKDSFAADVFNQFSKILMSTLFVIIPLTKIVIFTIMGKAYLSAWVYIPLFFCGVIFNSYSSFLNVGFYSAKKTKKLFYSTLVSSSVYFSIGILLAKPLYIFGVGIAYSVSELIKLMIVKKMVSPYMQIKVNIKQQVVAFLCAGVFIIGYYIAGIWVQFLLCAIASLLGIYINREFGLKLIRYISGKKSKYAESDILAQSKRKI